jgi:ribosomal protein S12 methylthiotransferase accessory factor
MSRDEQAKAVMESARILLVGVTPWGAVAASALAKAGVGGIHVLDDQAVRGDDLSAFPLYDEASVGTGRAAALAAAIHGLAPSCRVTTGPLVASVGEPLAAPSDRFSLIVASVPSDDLLVSKAVARLAHATRAPSISAHLDGLEAVIGPGVVPGETACWNCCRLRRLGNSPRLATELAVHTSLLADRPRPRARTYLAPTSALVGHTLARAALAMITSPASAPLLGAILVQNVVSLRAARHAVLPMSRCDVCGGAFGAGTEVDPRGSGVDLATAKSPSELLAMLRGVVSARTGIVRSVIVQPSGSSLDPELPVAASALLTRYVEDDHHPGCCDPELGAGKGGTTLRAMLTAVGEAVERYSAGRFDRDLMVSARVSELEGDLVTPEQTGLYAEAQYAEPDFPFDKLDPGTPIDWVRGHWLGTGDPVWLPALPVYMGYHGPPGAHFAEVTSNGLSAGPTLADAALGAALELVERDAFMISWLLQIPGTRVLVDRSVAPGAREAARQLEERGVRVELYHLDVGTGIPTIVSVGYGDGVRWPGATMSLSAHMSPRIAIEKALWEQGHIGPFLRRMVFDDKKPIPARPEDVITMEDHALYYVPPERARAVTFLGEGGVVSARDLPEPEEISSQALARKVARAGLRVAIADVTSPDLARTPFRVARAIGAFFQQIHFGHRFARLGNPRLAALARGPYNPDPHPLA